MLSDDTMAVPGLFASELSLPFAWLIRFLPVLVVGAYFAAGLLLRCARLGLAAWMIAFLLALLLGFLAASVPKRMLANLTQSIALTRMLEPQEMTVLRTKFPHPFVNGSASGEGWRLLVRKSDYDPALLDFLNSIHVFAADTGPKK